MAHFFFSWNHTILFKNTRILFLVKFEYHHKLIHDQVVEKVYLSEQSFVSALDTIKLTECLFRHVVKLMFKSITFFFKTFTDVCDFHMKHQLNTWV